MRVFREGRESGKAAEESGGEEGEEPRWRGFLGEVSEEAADQEAAEDITGHDANRKLVKSCFFTELRQ